MDDTTAVIAARCGSHEAGHSEGGDGQGHQHMSNALMLEPRIANMPHQHAMTIVGNRTLFAVHMTQFYMEEHKYQLIFELGLDDKIADALREARRKAPGDWFVLSNDAKDLFTVPELASGQRRRYRAQIFQGLPPFTQEDEASPHFYPWSADRVTPLFDDFEAWVERIVTFRPFDHHLALPEFPTYLIFGKGGEAHMTNLQTGRMASGPFESPAFGPDYDHVMSLAAPPDGLPPAQLQAGIVATLPSVRLREPDGRITIPGHWPYKPGDPMVMRYRGITPEFTATAGHSYLYGTAVCCSPSTLNAADGCLDVSPTPEYLLRHKQEAAE